MKILTFVVGMVQTNCYLAFDEESREGFLVDPGDNAPAILRAIREHGVKLRYILLTHSHFDHIMALAAVAAETGAEIAVHELEAGEIESPSAQVLRSLGLRGTRIQATPVAIRLKDGDTLTCAGETLTILHTPGHTVGSICIDTGKVLFSGDTLFEDDCGRCDLPGGDYQVMLRSLRRLADLPGDRIVYPGHDVSTTLARERVANADMRRGMALSL
ncbi:MAG: MBL fold metallo-hydrolase [Ruminococcaceae bacterium]|nr:MBL fold metallo-hydrolase [Oscillospiraceae bacterium]